MTDMTKLARLFQWALVPVMGRSSNIRIYWLVAFLALVTAVVNVTHLL